MPFVLFLVVDDRVLLGQRVVQVVVVVRVTLRFLFAISLIYHVSRDWCDLHQKQTSNKPHHKDKTNKNITVRLM
jgi:hypothetical protein